jgi:hypothetical protein
MDGLAPVFRGVRGQWVPTPRSARTCRRLGLGWASLAAVTAMAARFLMDAVTAQTDVVHR